jgi:hypothetical protein
MNGARRERIGPAGWKLRQTRMEDWMKFLSGVRLIARAACLVILAYGLHGVARADASTCQRMVGISPINGGTIADSGLCMPDNCVNLEICDEVVLVISVPLTHGCNCGDTGKSCTVAYVGTAGGTGGSTYCYNNDCQDPCPSVPSITAGTFTKGGVRYNILDCTCPTP